MVDHLCLIIPYPHPSWLWGPITRDIMVLHHANVIILVTCLPVVRSLRDIAMSVS